MCRIVCHIKTIAGADAREGFANRSRGLCANTNCLCAFGKQSGNLAYGSRDEARLCGSPSQGGLGYTISELFWPGIVLPGVTFALLYAWPFIEARVTGDRLEHHLLDSPRERPVRTAIGVGVLTFYIVLVVARTLFSTSASP